MSKKVKLYLGIFLLIAISIFYFYKRENENPYSSSLNKSYIETPNSNSDGQFIPEQKTDFIFTTTNTESDINIIFLIAIIVLLTYIIYLTIKKIRKTKQQQ